MRDLIDRQDAIDAFDCTNELIVGGEANAQNVMNYINKVVGKIKDLSSVEPEPGWTLCDDRLPDKPGKYLTYRYNNPYGFYKVTGFADDLYKIDECDFCDRKGKPGWYLYDSEYGYFELEVDAWMELPKPPERRTNE